MPSLPFSYRVLRAKKRSGKPAMMHKRSIFLLGLFLGSPALAVAQTPAPPSVAAYERGAPSTPILPFTIASSFLLSPLPASQNGGQYVANFGSLFTDAYDPGPGLLSLSPMIEVRTLFRTQAILPLVRFWGGRLELDGFTSEVYMQNVELGPSAAGGLRDFRPLRRSEPGGPRSVSLSGLSFSFHFGRIARAGHGAPIWRQLARIAH